MHTQCPATEQGESTSRLLDVAQSGRLLVRESVLLRLDGTWRRAHLGENVSHLARRLVTYFVIVNASFRARISVVDCDGLNS